SSSFSGNTQSYVLADTIPFSLLCISIQDDSLNLLLPLSLVTRLDLWETGNGCKMRVRVRMGQHGQRFRFLVFSDVATLRVRARDATFIPIFLSTSLWPSRLNTGYHLQWHVVTVHAVCIMSWVVYSTSSFYFRRLPCAAARAAMIASGPCRMASSITASGVRTFRPGGTTGG
ncbi:unnamed protein product, partial [Mycena citricolor]